MDRNERGGRALFLRAAARLCFAALAATFSGCGGNADGPLEEIFKQTYPLDSTAAVTIANEDGSIRVYGGGDELKIQATKKAYSARRLNAIKLNIVTAANSASITTEYPPKKKWAFSDRSGTVDYIVVVPEEARLVKADLANGELAVEGLRGGSVQARLGNGLLFARNCFTDLDLSLTTGNLSLSFDWWEATRFAVNGTVVRGNIWSFFPGTAAFHLEAAAPSGKIANDFLEKEKRRAEPTNKVDLLIGNDGNVRVKIRADHGNIRITETNPLIHMPSFDIVSEVDRQEVDNALNQARKELVTRFDLRDAKTEIVQEKDKIVLTADDAAHLKSLREIVIGKLSKSGVNLRNIEQLEPEISSVGHARQELKITQGLEGIKAKEIIQAIKAQGFKVQSQLQDRQIRVTGKKKDDLQAVIQFVRNHDFGVATNFKNFRD